MKELSEWAESLHNGYNRPPRTIGELAERFIAAFTPVTEALKLLAQAFVTGYANGMREAAERKRNEGIDDFEVKE